MKTLLLAVTLAVGLCAVSSAEAQTAASKTSRNNSTATATGTISSRRSRFAVQQNRTGNAVTATAPQVDGVIPRAIRSGNPLQMINPFAPAAYGNGRDVTRHEPSRSVPAPRWHQAGDD